MTRETKIGMLVGLAFIIVIGILLSDHMTSTTEPQRADPSFPGQQATPPAAPHAEQADEALDIPAFLRRQQS